MANPDLDPGAPSGSANKPDIAAFLLQVFRALMVLHPDWTEAMILEGIREALDNWIHMDPQNPEQPGP